jgi:hypothetical protein
VAKGASSWVRRAAKGTAWAPFIDYASPALYEVMPVSALFRQGKEFIANGLDGRRFEEARQRVEAVLVDKEIAIRLRGAAAKGGLSPLSSLDEEGRRASGQRILELYFGQIFASHVTILDLRASSFSVDDAAWLSWDPRAFYVEWQAEFLSGLRDLYAGFYLDDDPRFQRGLVTLDLEHAGDLMLSHLGGDDQRRVKFEMGKFQSSFHEMFLRCRDRGVSLHRNFIALGIYLVCLYEVLESLGLALDVRDAFERSYR